MIVWIVENGELVQYERTGECLMCGECCRGKLITGTTAVSSEEKNEESDLSDWEGFSAIAKSDTTWEWWRFVADGKTRECAELEGDKCYCHDDKPAICEVWPLHPNDIRHGCGYGFRRVDS